MSELKVLAKRILSEVKELGADMAQVKVGRAITKEFNTENEKFVLLRTLFDDSVSLTVFIDGRQGSVGTNSFNDDSIKTLISDAIAAANNAQPDDAWEIDASGRNEKFVDGPLECDEEKLFARAKELLDTIKNDYPKILVDEGIYEHATSEIVYLNSYGTCYESKKGMYEYRIGYSSHEGDTSSHGFGSSVRLYDLEKPFIDCGITRTELENTHDQSRPVPFEGKIVGSVVFTPGCLADVVFGTILENFVSDVQLIDGTSTWKDKIGTKIADERISLSLCPHDKRIVCGSDYSGEGYLTEDFDVIKDGVLKSFVLTAYGANKIGGERSGNTTSAAIVPCGEKSLDEIIADIDDGIMIGRFSGGRPGTNGEFSGIAKNSFRIRDGKIAEALSETMISANLNDMLNNLRDVSSETCDDGGMSMPYMAFDNVTISGK